MRTDFRNRFDGLTSSQVCALGFDDRALAVAHENACIDDSVPERNPEYEQLMNYSCTGVVFVTRELNIIDNIILWPQLSPLEI